MNTERNVAVCEGCLNIFPINVESEADNRPEAFDPMHCPVGVTYRPTANGFEARARFGGYSGLLALFGYLLFFVCVIAAGFAAAEDLGGFGIVFSVFAGTVIVGPAILAFLPILFGSVIVSRWGDTGSVRVGVGMLAWTYRFCWQDLCRVFERRWQPSYTRQSREKRFVIVVDGKKRFRFGYLLSTAGRRYVLDLMKAQLTDSRDRAETASALACLGCGEPAAAGAIDVGKDRLRCAACGREYSLSGLLAVSRAADGSDFDGFDPTFTWPGVSFRRTKDGFVARAWVEWSVSYGIAAFAIFWVLFATFGTVVVWTSAAEGNPWLGRLAMLPFNAVSLGMIFVGAMQFAGRVKLSAKGRRGTVRVGIGPFSWWRNFEWKDISEVTLAPSFSETLFGPDCLEMGGRKTFRFGSPLNAERLQYLKDVIEWKLRLERLREDALYRKASNAP